MDKNTIIEKISKMQDKQKAKVLSIILDSYDKNDDSATLGDNLKNILYAAVTWLS